MGIDDQASPLVLEPVSRQMRLSNPRCRVFDWPADMFDDKAGEFPAITGWFKSMKAMSEFAEVHKDIWDFWVIKVSLMCAA